MEGTSYKRGQLSPEIQNIAKKFFGNEITITELRLLPYILYIIQNDRYFEIKKLSSEELEILSKWKEKGLIDPTFNYIEKTTISKMFYNFINKVIWLSYINYDNQGEIKCQ